jgi:hypothetical protein
MRVLRPQWGATAFAFSLLRENWSKCDDPSAGLDSEFAQ